MVVQDQISHTKLDTIRGVTHSVQFENSGKSGSKATPKKVIIEEEKFREMFFSLRSDEYRYGNDLKI